MLSDFSQGNVSEGLVKKDFVELLLEEGEGAAQEESWKRVK